MQRSSVWLEVALNGAAGPGLQPNIPITPDAIIAEGVACAKAGAAVIHLHVYDQAGKPVEDADIYSRVIEGIKSQCDAIVYPTLGLFGDIEQRFAPIKTLAKRGLLEWSVVDPGSVNITHSSQIINDQEGLLYANPDSHIRAGLELAAKDKWRPAYAIYEPGFARLGAAIASKVAGLKTPIYRIMFSDKLLFGMAPSEYGLQFYAQHLSEVAPNAPWMMSGLDADIQQLIPTALELGAHIRVGLEDAPFACIQTNLELVESAVASIANSARVLASADDIRAYQG